MRNLQALFFWENGWTFDVVGIIAEPLLENGRFFYKSYIPINSNDSENSLHYLPKKSTVTLKYTIISPKIYKKSAEHDFKIP